MDHIGLTGYDAQTVLKMIADFAVQNNTFSQAQKSVHVNRWRQRLSCELAEVVGKSVPKGARAMLRRDDSARVEMDGSSEFERAELFQETLEWPCASAGAWACSAVWSKCWRRRTTTTATYRARRPSMRGGGR